MKTTAKNTEPLWVRPDWEELIPEAKTDFRCGNCLKLKPWQAQWESTLENVCDICDDCKERRGE